MIGILLCTYNGERYLEAQLSTIANQSYREWRIYCSDDGSTDKTIQILEKFRETHGEDRLIILSGPGQGATNNFLFLIRFAHQQCEYLAFCDQDDLWGRLKLERAINSIGCISNATPALYCSSTIYISEDGEYLQNSYVFKCPPSFGNALVQSIAGGNTMLFNRAAADLLATTPSFVELVAHDWWAYILISACNGFIFYDPRPSLAYRQHSRALVGENRSYRAMYVRIKKLFQGRFKEWNDANFHALICFKQNLNPESAETLATFQRIRSPNFLVRITAFMCSKIRRQTTIGNIALFLGVIANKI